MTIVPIKSYRTEYTVLIILELANMNLILARQAANADLTKLPESFQRMKCVKVLICFANRPEIEQFAALVKDNKIEEAVKVLQKG